MSDALISYQKTREQLSAQQALVTTEQRALELSTLRYRSGVATFLDVLDTERQLFSAELSVAQTQGAVLTSLVQLYQALGGGWDKIEPGGFFERAGITLSCGRCCRSTRCLAPPRARRAVARPGVVAAFFS